MRGVDEESDLRWTVRMRIRMRRLRRAARRRLVSPAAPSSGGSERKARTSFSSSSAEARGTAVAGGLPAQRSDRPSLQDLITPATNPMSVRSLVVLAAVVAAIGVIALIHHLTGVDWGDDFALYIRQAKALATGTIDVVVSDNRFSIANSGWHTFSPPSYPWGWPLLLAPFYAVAGLDYELFKGLEVAALCVYLIVFFAIVRRRAGAIPASVLMLLVGLSPAYIAHTGTVLSDLPYLCFVGLSLWWMDRCRATGLLGGNRYRLAFLGLLLAYTFNIRPEGVSLVAVLAALHVAVLGGMVLKQHSLGALREAKWVDVLLPYAVMGMGVLAFQLFLPGDLLPNAPGTGLHNASTHATFYQDIFAEHVGLKDAGLPMALFGSGSLARIAIAIIVALALIGLVGRLLERFEEDVTLAAYLCAASFIMFVSPYQEGRYLLTITPLVVYFAYQALPTLARLASGSSVVKPALSLVPAVAFAGLVALNTTDIARTTDYHLEYEYVVNGPESPAAQEMFDVVDEETQPDDVILFFRARAMTLYSDRRAIQGSALDEVLDVADWYVMAKGSTYSQHLVTETEAPAFGLTKRWENAGWVLWEVAPS